MKTTNNRQHWADYAKALAIMMMVICHFGIRPQSASNYLNIFVIPLFFLISGYFDKGKPYSRDVLVKNIKGIIIPYFFFSVCAFSICWISPYLHPELYNYGTVPQSFLKAFIGMFLMEDLVRPYAFMPMGALWFLPALFEIRITFSVMCYCWQRKKIFIIPILIIAFLLAYFRVPYFSIDSAAISLPFYVLGFFLSKFQILQNIKNSFINFTLALIGFAFLYFIGLKNGAVNYDGVLYGNNIYLFFINSIIGTFAVIFFSKVLPPNITILNKIGLCTLTILGTHRYFYIAGTTLGVLFFKVPAGEIPMWYIIILTVIASVMGIYIDIFLSKYCPKLIGKDKS